jgi:hypothetical protein
MNSYCFNACSRRGVVSSRTHGTTTWLRAFLFFLMHLILSPQTFTFVDQATLTHCEPPFPRPLSSMWCPSLRGHLRLILMLVHWSWPYLKVDLIQKLYIFPRAHPGQKSFTGLTKSKLGERKEGWAKGKRDHFYYKSSLCQPVPFLLCLHGCQFLVEANDVISLRWRSLY